MMSSGKLNKVIHLDNIICNGNVVKDSLGIAEAFNSYFANIGPNLADNIRVDTSPDRRSQGPRFESRRGTNVLWQDIDLHLPHSTQVMLMGTWQELIP